LLHELLLLVVPATAWIVETVTDVSIDVAVATALVVVPATAWVVVAATVVAIAAALVVVAAVWQLHLLPLLLQLLRVMVLLLLPKLSQ